MGAQFDRAGVVHRLTRLLQYRFVLTLQRFPRIVDGTLELIEVFVRDRPPLLHRGAAGGRWRRRDFGSATVGDDNTENNGQDDCGGSTRQDDEPPRAI